MTSRDPNRRDSRVSTIASPSGLVFGAILPQTIDSHRQAMFLPASIMLST